VNIVKYCARMYVNRKMMPVEAISGMGGGEEKGEWFRG
jgi:hypothetical protein